MTKRRKPVKAKERKAWGMYDKNGKLAQVWFYAYRPRPDMLDFISNRAPHFVRRVRVVPL